MKDGWQPAQTRAAADEVARRRQAVRDGRFRDRFDGAAALLLALFVLGAGLVGLYGKAAIDKEGYADPDILRPLPDERLLTNLRDSDAPFVGMAPLGDEASKVLFLRQDGQATFFDPETEIFSTDRLPDGLIDPGRDAPVLLGGGCGWVEPPPSLACQHATSAFVLTKNGGVLQRSGNGRWSTLLATDAWIGLRGAPVDMEDITAWATSRDGRWVALVAGADGAAVFDEHTGAWHVPDGQAALVAASEAGDLGLIPDRDGFWVPSSRGLGFIGIASRNAVPDLTWSTNRNTRFRDLEIAPDGRVLAITEDSCSTAGSACLSISEVRGVDDLSVIVGETEAIPGLSNASLDYAVMQSGRPVTIGTSGVHSYDPERRRWSTLLAGAPESWFADAEGTLWVSQGDQLYRFSGARANGQWTVDNGPFEQLAALDQTNLVGLNARGDLVLLPENRTLLQGQSNLPARHGASSGASIGTVAMVKGRRGVLLHDVVRREFSWFAGSQLQTNAPPLTAPGTEIHAANGRFWYVDAARGQFGLIALGGDFPNQTLTTGPPSQLAAPLLSVATAGSNGLWVVDAGGQSYLLTPGPNEIVSAAPQIGAARGGRGNLTMAAGFQGGVFLANPDGFWWYNERQRNWGGRFQSPLSGSIAGIQAFENQPVVLNDLGQVAAYRQDGWRTILGEGQPAAFGASQLSDALAVDQTVYLAGAGQVQRYDEVSRQFDGIWQGGAGDVRLITVVGGQPVWHSADRLLFGSSRMTPLSVSGAWRVQDGILAQIAPDDESPYLMHFLSPQSPPTCYFRGAGAPSGKFIDAIDLGDGRILTMTSGGVGVYVSSQRRWVRVSELPVEEGTRFHLSGLWLVAETPVALRTLPLTSLPQVPSCTAPELSGSWETSLSGRAAVFDPSLDQGVVLMRSGRIEELKNGATSTILRETNPGPRPDDIRTVAVTGTVFFAATEEAIWRYDRTRRWRRTPFQFPTDAGGVEDIDLTDVSAGEVSVTIWTNGGASFGGHYSSSEQRVELEALEPIDLPDVPTRPEAIRDVSERRGLWAVSSNRDVVFGAEASAALRGRLAFPTGVQLQPTPVDFGRLTGFVQGSVDAPERLFLLPSSAQLATLQGDLARNSFDFSPRDDRAWQVSDSGNWLWRISADGTLHRCSITAGHRAPSGCEVVLTAPQTVDPDSLTEATAHDGGFLIAHGPALVQYDAALRNPQTIAGPRVSADSLFFRFDGTLYVLEAPGGRLWAINDGLAESVVAEAERLRQYRERLVLKTNGETLVLTDDGLRKPFDGVVDPDPFAATFDWSGAGRFTALASDGFPIDETGERIGTLPIPTPEDVVAILPSGALRVMGAGRVNLFWVQRDGLGLELLEETTCVVEATTEDGAAEEAPEEAPDEEGGEEVEPDPPVQEDRCVQNVFPDVIPTEGLGRLTEARTVGGERITLEFERGALTVSTETGAVERTPPGQVQPAVVSEVSSDLARIRSLVEPLEDGRAELAPASMNNDRVLDSRRGVVETLASDVRVWSEMSHPAVRWSRSDRAFVVPGVTDGVILAPEAALPDGLWVQERPGRAARQPGRRAFYWLTEDTLWRYPGDDQPPVVVSRQDERLPDGLSEGRFLLPGGDRFLSPDGSISRATLTKVEQLGALQFSEDVRAERIRARLQLANGRDTQAMAQTGFQHDLRLGVGYRNGQVVVSTPVGILSAGSVSDVLPVPDGSAPRKVETVEGDVLADNRGTWHVAGPNGSWSRTSDPFAMRRPVDTPEVTWTVDAGRLDVAPKGAGNAWRVDLRRGLNFAVDRFMGAAGAEDHLVVATGLGTHHLNRASELQSLGAAADTFVPELPLDGQSVSPGKSVVFGDPRDRDTQIWDPALLQWRSPGAGEQPWASRRAVATDLYRIDFEAGSASAIVRKVATPVGQERFAALGWRQGERMPFDIATSIHSETGGIWIGTRWGLRWFANTALSTTPQVFDVSVAPQSSLQDSEAIRQVGRPAATRSRLLATGRRGGCVELDQGGIVSTCDDPSSLSERFVSETSLWTWKQSADGLDGAYRLADGSRLAIPTDPSLRWPHDRLRASVQCAGETYEVWSSGTLVRETGARRLVSVPEMRQLACLPDALLLGGGETLVPGVYAVSSSQAVQQRSAQGPWVPAHTPAIAREVRAWADGQAAFDARRLRIRVSDAGQIVYQHRTVQDVWREIGWSDGVTEMDKTLAAASSAPSKLDRITPVGVVTHESVGRSGYRIDPDGLLLRTAARHDAFANCEIDRAEHEDGGDHGVARADGNPLRFRCKDARVYREVPVRGRDIGAFERATTDPFAKREPIFQERLWRWSRTHTDPSQPPRIDIEFKGELVPLSAGRLVVDDYRSIAPAFDRTLELVSANGWWRHNTRRLDLVSAVRAEGAQSPEEVFWAGTDRDRDTGDPVLCLKSPGREIRIATDNQPSEAAACTEWRGNGRVWSYFGNPEGAPTAEGRALNSVLVLRRLVAGRFTDRIAVAVPRAVSLPRTDLDSGIAVPNAFGSLIVDPDGVPARIVSHPGLTGLLSSGAGGYLAAGPGRTAELALSNTGTCENIDAVVQAIPREYRILAIELRRGSDLVLSLVTQDGDVHNFSASCTPGGESLVPLRETLTMDNRPRHRARLAGLPDNTGTLRFQAATSQTASPTAALEMSDGRTRNHSEELSDSGALLGILGRTQGRTVLALFEDEAFLIDVDALIATLARATPSTVSVPEQNGASRTVDDVPRETVEDVGPDEPEPSDTRSNAETAPRVSGEEDAIQPVEPPAAQSDRLVPWSALERAEIRQVQEKLQALGLYSGGLDGIVGPKTRAGVSEYQKLQGVEVTGILRASQLFELIEWKGE